MTWKLRFKHAGFGLLAAGFAVYAANELHRAATHGVISAMSRSHFDEVVVLADQPFSFWFMVTIWTIIFLFSGLGAYAFARSFFPKAPLSPELERKLTQRIAPTPARARMWQDPPS